MRGVLSQTSTGLWMAGVLLGAALASAWLTELVRRHAQARSMLDIPNERSSHTAPTPRGGGLAIAVVVLGGTAILAFGGWVPARTAVALIGGGLAVTTIGWRDDRRHVSAATRAGVHFLAAAWAVLWLSGLPEVTFGRSPIALGWWGSLLAIVAIVWCVNLYNFMDGIDGIAASEATCVGLLASGLLVARGSVSLALLALLIAGASAGFLVWNWEPARIFMGDVGSGLLGFLFGTLAVASENTGALPASIFVLLLGVFVVDATLTLIRRAIRGEPWYVAHRAHAYQRAVQAGASHRMVTGAVLGTNVGLGLLAVYAVRQPDSTVLCLVVAAVALGILYGAVQHLYRGHAGNAPSP
jgi:Fuc2NAc and GlcNAc transferase